MKRIKAPTAEAIQELNEFVCAEAGNISGCYNLGKVESAIHTAFYPGSYPFAVGGITAIAASLCFYLVKTHAFFDGNKRTALLASITLLNMNGWDLRYPQNKKTGHNALAEVIEKCADGKVSKDELINWFETHKVRIKKLLNRRPGEGTQY